MSNTPTPLSREELTEDEVVIYSSFAKWHTGEWTAEQAYSRIKNYFNQSLKAFADEVESELPDKQFCSISRGCNHRWNDVEEKHMEYVKGFNRARKESITALKALLEKWGIK